MRIHSLITRDIQGFGTTVSERVFTWQKFFSKHIKKNSVTCKAYAGYVPICRQSQQGGTIPLFIYISIVNGSNNLIIILTYFQDFKT